MTQIEINISKLERGTHEGTVKVTRGGTTFRRKQRVGRKEPEKKESGISLKIKAKSGAEIPLVISGTKEKPIIKADGSFMMGGKKVTGTANIQHWKSKRAEEGLFFNRPKIYVQCAAAMPKVRGSIDKLSETEYFAIKTTEKVNADGDIISVGKWSFDRRLKTEKGTYISDSEMSRYLDQKGITEIEIDDAVKMWADEKEEKKIKANIEGNKRARAMDEASD